MGLVAGRPSRAVVLRETTGLETVACGGVRGHSQALQD